MLSTASESSDLGASSQPHGIPAQLRTEDQKIPDTQDFEKPPFLYTTEKSGGSEDGFDDNDPRVKDIPPYVRRIVSYSDDPTLPTLTFRYFLLSIVFVVPGAFLSMMSHYRTTYAPYSIFFVQIASSYVGAWLAKVLPAWTIRVPFTSWNFSLNPGPFSVKEHVLITITAASGATYNLGYTPISLSELPLEAHLQTRRSYQVPTCMHTLIRRKSSYILAPRCIRWSLLSSCGLSFGQVTALQRLPDNFSSMTHSFHGSQRKSPK